MSFVFVSVLVLVRTARNTQCVTWKRLGAHSSYTLCRVDVDSDAHLRLRRKHPDDVINCADRPIKRQYAANRRPCNFGRTPYCLRVVVVVFISVIVTELTARRYRHSDG